MTQIDFDKEVSKAHLEAAGWELNGFNSYNPFECQFVYVHDVDHQRIQLLSMHQSDFSNAFVPAEVPIGVMAHKLARVFLAAHAGQSQIESDPLFLPVLMAYIKSSRSYAVWREQSRARLHFFLNIYNLSRGVDAAYVRPFAAGSNDIIMQSKDVKAFSKHVLDSDRVNNPMWFA